MVRLGLNSIYCEVFVLCGEHVQSQSKDKNICSFGKKKYITLTDETKTWASIHIYLTTKSSNKHIKYKYKVSGTKVIQMYEIHLSYNQSYYLLT